jgi:hypothetical protein
MKLQALASKPQLVKVSIDDEAIVASYGEAIEFFIYDRQDMDTFMKLASLEGGGSVGEITTLVTDMVLDEKGDKILVDGNALPVDIMLKVVEKVITQLGNSVTQTLGKSAQS